ncbi:universal stress protein [Aeromicrobium sp. CTD01-1L150]|uniref:universal stress protein n=1 Tax=Aeromicrobium sp. CTD01-1L150 TaxID=3341830 RepID=UPI0035C05870
MHVLIATDGSKQSIASASYLRSIVDPQTVTKVAVVAVVSPMAAVPFANDDETRQRTLAEMSFRKAAEAATRQVAEVLDDWGPAVTTHVYSGSPPAEIIKAANRFGSGLIVIASKSTRTQAVLMGSVAHRVLNQATCPVLVHRPGNKPKRGPRKAAQKSVPKVSRKPRPGSAERP